RPKTLNLMGHALRVALGVIANQQGRGLAAAGDLAIFAGAPVLAGSTLKAALDLGWDEPNAREPLPLGLRLVELVKCSTAEVSRTAHAFSIRRPSISPSAVTLTSTDRSPGTMEPDRTCIPRSATQSSPSYSRTSPIAVTFKVRSPIPYR